MVNGPLSSEASALITKRPVFHGFVFSSSAVLGWEIGRSDACRDLGLAAADRLAGMFHPAAGVIPVGAQAEVAAGLDDVTIDCMVNLPLLWWAWKVTGEERFLTIAVSHADRTAGWHVKEDGRIIQSFHFDPRTGETTREETHQGSGTHGCWTRGQAWGVYGFAAAYRATGEERFLEVADRAATYYVRRAGADRVARRGRDAGALDPVRRGVLRERLEDIAELQWRLSTPLSTILLAVIGVPLSKSNPRRGKYAKLGVGIIIFAFYYQMFVIAKTWVEKALVPPVIGIWWVPLLLAALSVFLLWRTGEVFYRRPK